MINVQNIVLLILQLDHTRSYSIIIDLGSSLYALSNNLFVMFGAVKVSKILKVSEIIWGPMAKAYLARDCGGEQGVVAVQATPKSAALAVGDRGQTPAQSACLPSSWLDEAEVQALICLFALTLYDPIHLTALSGAIHGYTIWILDRIIDVFHFFSFCFFVVSRLPV